MEQTMTAAEVQSVRQIITNPVVGQDSRVSVSGTDQSMGYLQQKLVAGTNVTLTQQNPGALETLKIDVAGGGEGYTLGSMNIQINHDTGYDGPAIGETRFYQQSDVDAYLLSKGATAFKYPTKVWDRAIPENIWHQVRFYMQPGVHRPENPLPAGAQGAWDFCRIDANTKQKTFKKNGGYLTFYQGPASTDYYNAWESLLGDLTVVTANNAWSGVGGLVPPNYVVSGTPFGADNSLVGYWVISNTNFLPREIIANTGNTVYTIEGAPAATTIRICAPSAIFRNSYDDLTKAHATCFNFQTLSKVPGTAYVGYDSIRIDQFSGATGISGKDFFLATWCVLFDHARQKNLYPYSASFGKCMSVYNGNAYDSEGAQLWQCCYRGAKQATVPPGSTQEPFTFTTNQLGRRGGTVSLTQLVVSGFTAGIQISGTRVYFSQYLWADCPGTGGGHSINECDVSVASSPSGGFRTNMGLSFRRCNFTGINSGYDAFFMDGFTGTNFYAMYQFWNCKMRDSGGLGFTQGPNPNGGYAVLVVGPESGLWFRRQSTLTGANGEVHVAGNLWQDVTNRTKYTWTNLALLRGARFQPVNDTFLPAPAVTIEDMDPGLTVGTSGNQLVVEGSAKTITFNDGAGVGSAVSVAVGGLFKVNAASGKGVLVRVYPSLFGSGTLTVNLDVYYGRIYLPWHDVLIGMV